MAIYPVANLNFDCPLCGGGCSRDLSQVHRSDVVLVTCRRCGNYSLAHWRFPLQVPRVPEFLLQKGAAAGDLREANRLLGAYLSMYTRACTESGRPPELINLMDPGGLERIAQTFAFVPVPQKSDTLLRLLKKRTSFPGDPAKFSVGLDYPAVYAVDPSEARFYLNDLARKGLIELPGDLTGADSKDYESEVAITLTPAAYERLETAVHALATSRITSKSQITIPAAVRTKLNLGPGDTLMFEESETGTVYIRKSEPFDTEFLSALEGTLSEWNSENDNKAYGDL